MNDESKYYIFDEDEEIPESFMFHSDIAGMLQVGEIDKTVTEYYVDQQEAAVLTYSVIGLCPKLITVDFFKKLISSFSVNNTLKECLKEVSFDDLFFEVNSINFG